MSSDQPTRLEVLRTRYHEECARATAWLLNPGQSHCALRKCRRDRFCSGPMIVSDYQSDRVSIQKMLGQSGKACERLPLCVASRDKEEFQQYRLAFDEVIKWLSEDKANKLPKCTRALKGRQWPDPAATSLLTSSPCHPTSSAETKG